MRDVSKFERLSRDKLRALTPGFIEKHGKHRREVYSKWRERLLTSLGAVRLQIGRNDIALFITFGSEIILSAQLTDKQAACVDDVVAQCHEQDLQLVLPCRVENINLSGGRVFV